MTFLSLHDYVAEICGNLKFIGPKQPFIEKAVEILQAAEIGGCKIGDEAKLKGFVAAAVYISTKLCGEWRTQDEISAASSISTRTIAKRWKELASAAGLSYATVAREHRSHVSARS